MSRFKYVYLVLLLILLFSVQTVAQAGTPGALMPLGDQLGDVGQYYSQSAPSQESTIYVSKQSGAVTGNVTITLYNDIGNVVVSVNCPLAADERLMINVATARTIVRYYTNGGVFFCYTFGVLHGVYHAKITSATGPDIYVATRNWQVGNVTQAVAASVGVPSGIASNTSFVPTFYATRNTSGTQWDTEVVVMNASNTTQVVIFTICPPTGVGCWANNSASLLPNERRIFLASQLLYKPNGIGGLIEQAGWHSATINTFGSASLIVNTRLFQQSIVNGKVKAENGSLRVFQIAPAMAGTDLRIPQFIKGNGGQIVLVQSVASS